MSSISYGGLRFQAQTNAFHRPNHAAKFGALIPNPAPLDEVALSRELDVTAVDLSDSGNGTLTYGELLDMLPKWDTLFTYEIYKQIEKKEIFRNLTEPEKDQIRTALDHLNEKGWVDFNTANINRHFADDGSMYRTETEIRLHHDPDKKPGCWSRSSKGTSLLDVWKSNKASQD